jgi:hypothetical protein
LRDSVFKKVLGKPKNINLIAWVKLLFLEIYLGEQLIEMLSNTSSYNTETKDTILGVGAESNGWKKELSEYIPSTYINRKLESHIISLLRTKYIIHYGIMKRVKSESLEYKDGKILYKLNGSKLYLLTELKLAYNTIWVTLNIAVDLLVYLATHDLTITLAVGAAIEFIRRFKW